jgi:hypothetical protein
MLLIFVVIIECVSCELISVDTYSLNYTSHSHCNKKYYDYTGINGYYDKLGFIPITGRMISTNYHYRLLIFNGIYMTDNPYDCEKSKNGDINIYVWHTSDFIDLENNLLKCNGLPTDKKMPNIGRSSIIKHCKNSIISCNELIVSGKYVKLLKCYESEDFLKKNTKTIILKTSSPYR